MPKIILYPPFTKIRVPRGSYLHADQAQSLVTDVVPDEAGGRAHAREAPDGNSIIVEVPTSRSRSEMQDRFAAAEMNAEVESIMRPGAPE